MLVEMVAVPRKVFDGAVVNGANNITDKSAKASNIY
jgi:hypothetical protein